MRIAIYDLDRTLTRRPTFTPFLVFAARRLAPWRLALLPAWVVLMALYRAGLFSRTTLKRMGMHLMTGAPPLPVLERVGAEFAERRIAADGLMPGAVRLLEGDQAVGARVVLATAAFGFYAAAFARHLKIEEVVATSWNGTDIPGGNCYGAAKLARVEELMGGAPITRMVSDSFADAPLMDRAAEAIFVTKNARAGARARLRGWDPRDLSH